MVKNLELPKSTKPPIIIVQIIGIIAITISIVVDKLSGSMFTGNIFLETLELGKYQVYVIPATLVISIIVSVIIYRIYAKSYAHKIKIWALEKYDIDLHETQAFLLALEADDKFKNKELVDYISDPVDMGGYTTLGEFYVTKACLIKQKGNDNMQLIDTATGVEFATIQQLNEYESIMDFMYESNQKRYMFYFVAPEGAGNAIATLGQLHPVFVFWNEEEDIQRFKSENNISYEISAAPYSMFESIILPDFKDNNQLLGFNWDQNEKPVYPAKTVISIITS